jgi:hypothetical protein
MTTQPEMPPISREQMEKYWNDLFTGESILVQIARKQKRLDEDEVSKVQGQHSEDISRSDQGE